MARKPNFSFERQERDKAKVAKKIAKADAKAAKKVDSTSHHNEMESGTDPSPHHNERGGPN